MNTTVSRHGPADALSLDAAEMARRFRQHKDIRLVFLFGSRVIGRSRKDSDIDIAFWLDPWPGASDFNLIGRLVNACAGIFPSHLIDVVILNEASSVLRLRVVQTGRLLYERAPGDRKRFAMQTAKDSQDGEYRRKLAYNWRLERIKKGGQHGNREIFLRRLEALRGYLGKLEPFKNLTLDEFVAQPAIHDLAERYLHLMMECVLDLGNHYLADQELGIAEINRDIFLLLQQAGE